MGQHVNLTEKRVGGGYKSSALRAMTVRQPPRAMSEKPM